MATVHGFQVISPLKAYDLHFDLSRSLKVNGNDSIVKLTYDLL